ncbi:hypothetical protein D9757_007896 [Collybiopsis confluens]|uniref:Uncharacterized protein n=1 Tax=Collybiopsis confluens TaxID=2823264 RepID=A0A8H5M576_9AGAR|nr:hypothetical protein D9757_007896 [Collybiopsis confluens]
MTLVRKGGRVILMPTQFERHFISRTSDSLLELQSLAPMDFTVQIYQSEDPIVEAYRSAQMFASKPDFSSQCVTREEYLESGSNASRRKFRDWQVRVQGEREQTAEEEEEREEEQKEGKGQGEQLQRRLRAPMVKRGRGRPRGSGVGR